MIGYEQALALCRSDPESAARLICDLSAKVDLLLRKVSELERKVASLLKNSTNSSKPPSSDRDSSRSGSPRWWHT